jgi:hypothetical protein
MTRQLIVGDNFYSNPVEVRRQALKMSFGSTGYFPGRRTAPVVSAVVQSTLEGLVGSRLTRWTNFHGSFHVGESYVVGAFRRGSLVGLGVPDA